MAEVDFSDNDQVKAWLETQSVEMRCAFASRAALRVCANIGWKANDQHYKFALAVFRAALISAVRGSGRTAEIDQLIRAALSNADPAAHPNADPATLSVADSAALSAHSASLSVVGSADLSALSAALSARSASLSLAESAFSAAGSAALSNAVSIISAAESASAQDAIDLSLTGFLSPLWPNLSPPEAVQASHEFFLAQMAAEPEIWGFWHDWYLAMWEGRFDDWDLAIEIAKIEDAVWKAGPKAVAEAITAIRERLLVERLPQAEIIFLDGNGRYEVKSTISNPAKLTDSVLSRATFAFETALTSNSCDLNAMSLPARILRHVLENCFDDPNAIEQFFRQASDMIKGKVEEGRFADDDALRLLVDTLDECALQLRADHPEVAEASETRVKQSLREISDEKRLELAKHIDDLTEVSGDRLGAEFALAAETTRSVSDDKAQASAIKISGERAAKMNMLERAKSAESSGAMAGLKMGLRGKRVVEIVWALISGSG